MAVLCDVPDRGSTARRRRHVGIGIGVSVGGWKMGVPHPERQAWLYEPILTAHHATFLP